MKMKLAIVALFQAVLFCAGAAHATTIVRPSSNYGGESAILVNTSELATPITLPGSGDFQEILVCTNSSPGFVIDPVTGVGACTSTSTGLDYDLLLSITSDANDGTPFTINLPDFTPSTNGAFFGNYSFGIATCDRAGPPPFNSSGNQPITENGATFCTSPSVSLSATCSTQLENLAAGGTFEIPGDCVANGVTFYFDETGPGAAAPDFQTVATPEPGSIWLVFLGLALLVSLGRKRVWSRL